MGFIQRNKIEDSSEHSICEKHFKDPEYWEKIYSEVASLMVKNEGKYQRKIDDQNLLSDPLTKWK